MVDGAGVQISNYIHGSPTKARDDTVLVFSREWTSDVYEFTLFLHRSRCGRADVVSVRARHTSDGLSCSSLYEI